MTINGVHGSWGNALGTIYSLDLIVVDENRMPTPLTREQRVRRLLEHLERSDVPNNVDLTAVGFVPGWRLDVGPVRQKGARHRCYYVYAPVDDPNPMLPWAFPPSDFCGTHGRVVGYLREHWAWRAEMWLDALDEVQR